LSIFIDFQSFQSTDNKSVDLALLIFDSRIRWAHSHFPGTLLITKAIMLSIRIDKSQFLSIVRLSAFLIRLSA